MTNETAEKTSPSRSIGKRSCRGGTPREPKARSSLSEESLPTAIRAPTRDPKGNEKAMTMGREKTIRRSTSQKGTFLEKISSAMTRIWLMKNRKKKKRNATTKEMRYSRPT